jgi:hypothetical protein
VAAVPAISLTSEIHLVCQLAIEFHADTNDVFLVDELIEMCRRILVLGPLEPPKGKSGKLRVKFTVEQATLPLTSALHGVGGQRHALAALSPGETRYPLYSRLGGAQGRSERVRKISPPTGIRSPDRPASSESLSRPPGKSGTYFHQKCWMVENEPGTSN